MPSLKFELARAEDDPGLRRLLRANPMPGSISLSFEREPNYFNASLIEGRFHQTLVAHEMEAAKLSVLAIVRCVRCSSMALCRTLDI